MYYTPDSRRTLSALRSDTHPPFVMGILNVTPDSFSDGGRFVQRDAALRHALAMIEAGAEIIDIGGESTRPGAPAVEMNTELDRVVPVIEAIATESDAALCVDTNKPEVMRAAVAAGAVMINDVCALRNANALDTAAGLGVAVCLMHMQGQPHSMQDTPRYGDVVHEVRSFLLERAMACESGGIARDHIVIDPGFGFGKTRRHNLALLERLDRFVDSGYPVLVGLSRKSMIGGMIGRAPDERSAGSTALALIAAQRGAVCVRVHDVAETCDVLAVWEHVRRTPAETNQ